MNLAWALIGVFCSVTANAYETDDFGYQEETRASGFSDPGENRVDDGRRHRKFELVLKTLNIPEEQQPDFRSFPNAGEASEDSFLQSLRFIDPESGLRRYLDLQANRIDLYRDFFSHLLPRSLLDYTIDVREDGENQDSEPLMQRLTSIAMQVQNPETKMPLEGVRIVIDPGHMGSSLWDELTGKYVQVGGLRASEGELNLLTSFLVAQTLENLGATVKLTRSDLVPVSKKDYQTYDTTPYINQYFYDSLDDWLTKYLHLGDLELARVIKTAPEVKKVYSNDQRAQLFIKYEDLEARARLISDFHPDLTIDIHFDASKNTALQKSRNDVEAYVPGGFQPNETGSRSMKAHALKHALEARRWNASVNFADAVTLAVSKSLGLPRLDVPTFMTSVKVKDGVYARNLYLTRRSFEGLVVYLECLHYDHVNEFKQLAKKNKSGLYKGMPFKYPARLEKISEGIREGVLNYFKNLGDQPGSLKLENEQIDFSYENF